MKKLVAVLMLAALVVPAIAVPTHQWEVTGQISNEYQHEGLFENLGNEKFSFKLFGGFDGKDYLFENYELYVGDKFIDGGVLLDWNALKLDDKIINLEAPKKDYFIKYAVESDGRFEYFVGYNEGYKNVFTSFNPEMKFSEITSAVVPVPGAVLLGSIGVSLVGWFRRRKSL